MRIAVDLQACQADDSKNRGIGRYSFSLAKALVGAPSGHHFQCLLNKHYPESIQKIKNEIMGIRKDVLWKEYTYPCWGKTYDEKMAQELVTFSYHQTHAAIVHISSVFEGKIEKAVVPRYPVKLKNMISSATLYDLIPLIYQEIYLESTDVRKWYYEKLSTIKNTDLLLAISESSRRDAINYLNISPTNIINISAGVDSIFQKREMSPDEKNAFLKRYHLSDKFILYTGGTDYRKNLQKVIDAYAHLPSHLKQAYSFVVVCSMAGKQKASLLNYAKQKGLSENNIRFTGFVSDEDLVVFYNLCSLFIFPSLYEGFGLPVLEAMSCGAPVIGSNNSSIPEIINFKEALFNPHSAEEMGEKMQQVLQHNDFRAQLIARGLAQAQHFSWKRTAELALTAFEEAYARKQPRAPVFVSQFLVRRKIAYFSPLPNARSGIANYSAELLPYLSKHFDIDLYVDQEAIDDAWLTANFNIFHWREFFKRSSDYAEIVYHFGNSEFHAYMYDIIQEYPGIVVLHDFFLSGLVWYIEYVENRSKFLLNEARYSHNINQIQSIEETIMSFPCNRRILASATGIIVHSPYLIALAEKFYGQKGQYLFKTIPSLQTLGKTISIEDRLVKRVQYGFSENDIVICSFGFLANTKLNDVIIQAFAQSTLKQNSNIKLVFVGELSQDTDYFQKITALIQSLGISDRILISGYVSSATYEDYLSIADLAVQLRAFSRGETSAAVLDCLAYGLPVIVNAYATFNDYPDEVVYKISEKAPVEELIMALDTLSESEFLRKKYQQKSKQYVNDHHAPVKVAAEYALAIHEFMESSSQALGLNLAKNLAEIFENDFPSEDELSEISTIVMEKVND